jgi:hypothetical protein
MRMYEQNQDFYSNYPCDYELLHSNVISQWQMEKFAFVNWGGHGSPYSSHIYGLGMPAFIVSSDCPLLNDDYPAIIFAFACSNSDTEYLNIGQAMLEQGAVGFLGATNVAYGANSWDHPNDGSSQSLDYFFTTCVTSGDYTQGRAHQWALRKMYTDGLWTGNVRFQMFAWGALWGNPDLGMTSFEEFPIIRLGDITGGTTGVSVVISNVGTVDATNVEWNIRIDGGLFMIPREKSGIESLISIGDSKEINMSVFGVGLGIITKIPRITVAVGTTDGGTIQQTATAQIFLSNVNIK